jgi:hypothetical protein
MNLRPSSKIPRLGEKSVSEKTDIEYSSKRLARIIQDYKACPDDWKSVFWAGIDPSDRKALKEQFNWKNEA